MTERKEISLRGILKEPEEEYKQENKKGGKEKREMKEMRID